MAITWTLVLVAALAFLVGGVVGPLVGLWLEMLATRRQARADWFTPRPPGQALGDASRGAGDDRPAARGDA